jgi:hypothetical protein
VLSPKRLPLRQLVNLNEQSTMKKFLAVLAIAGTLVACNNEGENSTTTDSTTVTNTNVDSTVVTPLVDTTSTNTTTTTTTTTDSTQH